MNLKNRNSFNKRIHELDFFRGFLIILVMIDHLAWFINFYLFNSSNSFLISYWTSSTRTILREIVLASFMFTCGISCHLSSNNKKRGLILLSLSIFISIITHIGQLLPLFNNRVIIIDINILGVIALSILLYDFISNTNKKNMYLYVAILMVFYSFIVISNKIEPDMTYNPFKSILLSSFNPIKEGYVGDYLPLFPYIIYLFIGAIIGNVIYKNKTSVINKKGNWERPICFLGRHTLLIYIGHEIIFTIIFTLINLVIK